MNEQEPDERNSQSNDATTWQPDDNSPPLDDASDFGTDPNGYRPNWGPTATLWLGAVVFLCFFLVQVVVFFAFLPADLLDMSDAKRNEALESLVSNGQVLAICTWASALICVPLIVFFVALRGANKVYERLHLGPISLRTTVILSALTAALIVILDSLSTSIGVEGESDFVINAYSTSGSSILLWSAICIAAPVFEELFFRGFLLEGLRRSAIGDTGAVMITAAGWSLIHLQYSPGVILVLFIFGIVLGHVRLRTRSIRGVMLMHAIWNFVALLQVAAYLANSE